MSHIFNIFNISTICITVLFVKFLIICEKAQFLGLKRLNVRKMKRMIFLELKPQKVHKFYGKNSQSKNFIDKHRSSNTIFNNKW